MRPQDIISNLQALGYKIHLNKDVIVLNISTLPQDKKTAQTLIDELKRSKADVMSALRAREWPAAEKMLVDWFLAAPIPEIPFQLRKAENVVYPEVFWASIKREIHCGSRSPRARTGVLQADLRALMAMLTR